MRLLVTADLHYNHPRSRAVADELIDRMNRAGGDVLLVVGDTAAADGDELERCLSRFTFGGPKLLVAGNHELWTLGDDSYQVFRNQLPRRARELGWHWVQTEPLRLDGISILGSVGWYDYAFGRASLGIPRRFYEHKISPGAVERCPGFGHLLHPSDDISDTARNVVARWNDGRYVKLGRSDQQFLDELLAELEMQLVATPQSDTVVVAVHHVPFEPLLPPSHGAQWDFARAYLGSPRIGELLLRFENVRWVLCGHSHVPAKCHICPVHAVNIGSGYRWKTFQTIDL